jgi:hypothetical protein
MKPARDHAQTGCAVREATMVRLTPNAVVSVRRQTALLKPCCTAVLAKVPTK